MGTPAIAAANPAAYVVPVEPGMHDLGPQALEFAHLIGDVNAEAGEIGRKTLGDAPQYLGNPLIADGGGFAFDLARGYSGGKHARQMEVKVFRPVVQIMREKSDVRHLCFDQADRRVGDLALGAAGRQVAADENDAPADAVARLRALDEDVAGLLECKKRVFEYRACDHGADFGQNAA